MGKKTAVQLGFDQLINAPIVVAGFFCAFRLVSAVADCLTLTGVGLPALGTLLAAMRTQLAASWASTVIANWKAWVIPQLINFAFIPPWGRVAFASAVSLVWNVILSVRQGGTSAPSRIRTHTSLGHPQRARST